MKKPIGAHGEARDTVAMSRNMRVSDAMAIEPVVAAVAAIARECLGLLIVQDEQPNLEKQNMPEEHNRTGNHTDNSTKNQPSNN